MQDGKRTLEGELHRAKKNNKKKYQGGGINLVKEKPSLPISNQAEETEGQLSSSCHGSRVTAE